MKKFFIPTRTRGTIFEERVRLIPYELGLEYDGIHVPVGICTLLPNVSPKILLSL